MSPHEELVAHEQLCAERYATIHKRLDRIEAMLWKLIWGIMTGFGAIAVAVVLSNIHL